MEERRTARGSRLVTRAALAVVLLAGPVGAATDALSLARAGRCEEALPGLAALRRVGARSDAALREAQCLIRLRRHADAAPLLEALVEREPALAEAWLHLAIARFHLGDAAGAEAALDAAPALADRPEARLYRGLALLARGEAGAAAPLLDGISSGSAGPIAGYWAGVAWLRTGEDARARNALRRVSEAAPGTSWAAQSEALLAGTAAERLRPWWIRVTAGYEYDDNVVLRAGDVPLAREVSSQRDTRSMWRVEAGSQWWRSGAWASGAWISYSGTAHDDLGALDVQLPTIGLWLDRRLDAPTILRLAYDFGWAFVDEESFLQSHGATASAIRSFGALGTAQLFGRFYTYDYHVDDVDVPDGRGVDLALCPSPLSVVCGAAGVNEKDARDRDGYGTAAGLVHTVPLPRLRSEVSLGYTYYRYWAEGKEQSYAAHELRVGTRSELPLGLELRLDASYAYRPYRHASSVPEPFTLYLNRQYPTRDRRRRDEVARVEVGLERRIADRVLVGVLYSYVDSDSNVSLFDYDRQIVGSYLTIGLGPGRWAR